MNILLIEPYFTGSHATWAEGYKAQSGHNVEILSLEGRYWKWRMHGGAVTLARRFSERGYRPDLILATDMLDLTTFLSLTREQTSDVPVAVYFHENQLTYPWSPDDRDVTKGRDGHYGFINFSTALAADTVFFNSQYHMDSFLSALSGYLSGLPDYRELETVELVRAKSEVLQPGMDFALLDSAPPPADDGAHPPLILWNHRWEYDKNPAEFFAALEAVRERGVDFMLAVLGENFRKAPDEFEGARRSLGERVVHFGFVEDHREYAGWLNRADILPVTSDHDFFGCSVVEAIYCGCVPILPRRLAYPEHLGKEHHELCLYEGFDELVEKLESAITGLDRLRGLDFRAQVLNYGWDTIAPAYDAAMERVAELSLRLRRSKR